MKRIVFPLKLQMKRSQVADLHQALAFISLLIDNVEKENRRFGKSTLKAVSRFQEDHRLPVTGVVDETTARALNGLLAERGALDEEIIYLVTGAVRRADGKPAIGLKVQAYDRDMSGEGLLGSAVSDEDGAYRINFTADQFKRTDAERGGPEVFIRVSGMAGEELGQSKIVKDAPLELNLDLTLSALLVKDFVVKGNVAASDGQSIDNIIVKAFDRNVGADDKLLGQATTDGQGSYSIFYTLDELGGKSAADMVIALYREGQLLQNSDVIFNAGPEVMKDFIIFVAVVPEFQRLSDKIKPLLGDRVKLGGLEKDQADFLSQKTGVDAHRIEWLTQSHRIGGKDESLTAFYYALLSQGLPSEPNALLSLGRDSICRALKHAVTFNLIPAIDAETLDRIFNQDLPGQIVEKLLQTAPAEQRASLGDILRTIPQVLPDGCPEKVAKVISEGGIDYNQFQDQLKTAGLTTEQAIRVERALRLKDLTLGNIPLIQDLQEEIENDPEASLDSLAKLRRDQWIDKAYTYGLPTGSDLSPEEYANQLERTIEELHPTAVLTTRIESGDLVISRPGFEKVGTFLTNNPDFDILNPNIPSFLKKANLNDVGNKNRLTQSLLKLQRIKKLSVTWDEAGVLLNNGLDSALQVVEIGRQRLQQRLAGDVAPERAAVIYQNAKQTHDFGLALMARIMPRFSPAPVAAMGMATRLKEVTRKDILKEYPTLQELFGSLDYCEYNPHLTVLSPAAYLVDLLQFLGNAGEPQHNALNALLERRPDLVDMELSAGNTKTELPYIDLVLEILENTVTLPLTIPLSDLVSGEDELYTSPLSSNITDVLQLTSLEKVGSNLIVKKVLKQFDFDTRDAWTVKDQRRNWTLYNQPGDTIEVLFNNTSRKFRITLSNSNTESLSEELSQGRLSPQIQEQLEKLLQKRPGKRYFYITGYSVSTLVAGKQWKVNCRLGVIITIDITGGQGSLTLKTPDGREVLSTTYSLSAIRAILSGLKKGNALGPLVAHFPDSNNYKITPGPEENSWRFEERFNDQLQFIIEPDQLTITALTYQTTGDSEELKASPGNQNPYAYEKLRQVNFPWSLPLNLPLEAVRAFLEQAGVSRRQLIQLSKPESYLDDRCWVYEVLGISSEEAYLISNDPTENRILWKYWGLNPDNDGKVRIYDAAAGESVPPDNNPPGDPFQVLSRVSILMQQARLSYDDLLKVLQTRCISRNKGIHFTMDNPAECQPDKMHIQQIRQAGLGEFILDRMHRFIRLWRKTGWEINELDMAIFVFQTHRGLQNKSRFSTIDNDILKQLAHIKQLHEMLDLPINKLVSWWSGRRRGNDHRWWSGHRAFFYSPDQTLGQPEPTTLYEQLFVKPFVGDHPADPDFAINGSKTDLQNPMGAKEKTLGEKAVLISAALGITREDFNDLLSLMLQPNSDLPDETADLLRLLHNAQITDKLTNTLTHYNLFMLYRTVGLTKALQISFADFFRLQLLMNCSPFDSTAAAVEFCKMVKFIQNSGFTIEELSYLLLHESSAGSPFEIYDDQIAQKLSVIRLSLQTKLNALEQQVKDRILNNPGGPVVLKSLTGQAAVNADASTLNISFVPGDNEKSITSNLILPSRGIYGSTITWSSSDQNIISIVPYSNALFFTGTVNWGNLTQDNTDLIVTATVAVADNSASIPKDFKVTVLKNSPDEQAAVDAAAALVTIGYAPGDGPSSVSGNLTLPIHGIHNTNITWISSSGNITKKKDLQHYSIWEVSRPKITGDDLMITLEATISVSSGATVTRKFNITVPKQLSGTEAVRADAAALTIGYAPGDGPYGITQDLILVNDGSNGSNITWSSSDRAVLGNDGKIKTRPAETADNICVVMTATITNADDESIKATKIFYSPMLLDKTPLDANRLVNILSDSLIHEQLVDVGLGMAANLFGLDVPVARRLLVTGSDENALFSCTDSTGKTNDGIEAFLEPHILSSNVKIAPDRQSFPVLFHLSHQLHKVAVILTRLNVKPAQINWFANLTGMAVLKFNQLPTVEKTTDGAELFQAWRRSVILFKICNSIPKMDALLTKYIKAIAAKDIPQAQKTLADGLKLPVEMIRIAVVKLGMVNIAQYQDPSILQDLLELLSAMKKLGVDTKEPEGADKSQIEALTNDSVALDFQAEVLARSLLRAKYGSESWRDVIKPISDKLRILQRDALVDYLIHREQFRDANDLYEYYLIDPQMSPLMMTSRLVQATAAVQLFVQQCLLNLVDGVTLNEDERKRWEWMKNYRVWEANRKVFLYPENWLYPELRDDKTQIFKQLESGIAQGEPNYQLTKDNLLLYMDEIAEIAKIKVYGMYYAEDGTLYAVGRTPNQPYRYYWRKCEDFGGVRMHWYGWERIDMDINDDHVMPFVLEGNLYIAWPTITTKINSNNAKQEWEIKLNWTCYTGKGWSQKKVTKDGDSIKISGVNADFNALNYITIRLYYPNSNTYQILDFPVYLASNIASDQSITPPFSSNSCGIQSGGSQKKIDVQVIERIQGTSKYYYGKGYKVNIWTLRWVWKLNPGGQIAGDGYNGEWDISISEYSGELKTKADGTCSFSATKSFARAKVTIYSPDGTYLSEQNYPYVSLDYPDLPYSSNTTEGTVAPFQTYIPNAYFNVIVEVPPHQEAAVHMDIQGKFRLNALTDIVKLDDKTGPTLPFLGKVTEFYGNGYRTPTSGGQRFELTINHQILSGELKVDGKPLPQLESQNSGEFFIVEAGKGRQIESKIGLGYYEDVMKKIYIKGENNGSANWYGILDNIMNTAGLRLAAYSKFDRSGDGFYSPASQSYQDGRQLIETIIMVSDSSKSLVEKSIGFNLQGPSALYNWEIFYHAPLLVAEFLTKQQRFEDAQRWLHYIFNPTAPQPLISGTQGDNVSGFWQFLPFRETENNLQDLFAALVKLAENQTTSEAAINEYYTQISNWLASPFAPFAVARGRWTAFQWRTIFAYLDNLIAWGDQMFRRFTRESMNEAIQYYVLALRLLGPRPQSIKPPKVVPVLTYRDIYSQWGDFWKDWYNITNHLPTSTTPPQPANDNGQTEALISLGMSCFGIPHNDKLTTYWDTVEDRLFKIRNCMDIEGVTRDLPLFAPPIDPMLLVRATAAGLDIDTVLADMDAPLLPYRFQIIVQKANEICAEVKSLGSALLATLEKKDTEGLALLRSGQEVALLNLATQVKQRQVEEANANIDNLNQSKAVAMARLTQYQKLLGKAVSVDSSGLPVLSSGSSLQVAANAAGEEAGLGLIQYEVGQLSSLDKANNHMEAAGITNMVSSILHALPNISVGAAVISQIGGSNLGSAAGAVAAYFNMLAGNANHEANRKSLFASYQRRQDDWVYQSKLALEEMKQLNKQIIAAQIRLDMAQKELNNHLQQIRNAQAVDDFMHQKYTNQELYSWMSGQISNVYFNCYQLAYDLAKRAEKAFRNELALNESNFIQFGYWDSLKKGLMAGENLSFDLKRIEVAYLEQNRRELEITKHVSLALLNPLRLLDLKENGECQVELAETLFDLDYPGHYLRRIKSMSLTIPCVTGPYTSINCKLTLLKHSVRTKASLLNNHYRQADQNDPRFREGFGLAPSIATSHGQNDSGLFEVNFHDERYLPFEGAGAVSTWRLEMPQECNAFDFNTISDVILHIKYTAREGGEILRKAAMEAATPSSGIALISACHDFSSEWYRFLNPDGNGPQKFIFTLGPGHLPFMLRGKTIEINQMDIFVQPPEGMDVNQMSRVTLTLSRTQNGQTQTFEPSINLVDAPNYQGMLYGKFENQNGTNPLAQFKLESINPVPKWTLESQTNINAKDLIIVCNFTVSK